MIFQNKKYWLLLLLLLIILVPYLQVLKFDFIPLDDDLYVYDNAVVKKGLSLDALKWAFTNFLSGNWHPLTWVSHLIDVEMFGLNAAGHHWTNLVFHILNSSLLFIVFNQMTQSMLRSVVLAALFAIHPLHAESVIWISERKDVLSTFFFMASIGFYYSYVKNKTKKYYLAVLISIILGLMSKAMLVTIPLVLLLLDFWPLNRALATTGKDNKDRYIIKIGHLRLYREILLEKVGFSIPVVASCFLTLFAQNEVGAVRTFDQVTLIYRLENAFISYVRYITHTVWPEKLAIYYPLDVQHINIAVAVSAGVVILAVSCLSLKYIRSKPYFFVGWFWYLGTLIPVIGLIQVGGQAMADRYTYIPLIGLFIIIVWGSSDLLKKIRYGNLIAICSALVILFLLTYQTFIQAGYWSDSRTLFKRAIDITENNYFAHNLLGRAYFDNNETDKAIAEYEQSIKISKYYEGSHINMAIALHRKGKTIETISHLKQAFNINPESIVAMNNLSIAYMEMGMYEKAAYYLEKALKINPEKSRTNYLKAQVLLKMGKISESIPYLEKSVLLNPCNESALYELGEIMLVLGHNDRAVTYFQKAAKKSDSYSEAFNRMGDLLMKYGKNKQACKFYREALKLRPLDETTRLNVQKCMDN
jgi:protein O-mannosyl-transferase